jgi:serine/threonine protein kinase
VEVVVSNAVHRIDEIFWEAAQLAPGDQRESFLDRACGADQELRQRVSRLVQVQPKIEEFLERPFAGPASLAELPEPCEGPGTVIGPYKLLEQIGEGGFGIVYMAEQQQPLRRTVALKVIKPGMDTRQVIARFEAERQALAMMNHANIARVLDAGATESGRPFFVMELVRGTPITQFCDDDRLTPRERLDLFVAVCQAVQHAHQKGIIHRDLKPNNVLVTLHDGTPVVKVIDFGIAKALGQERLTDKTLVTGFAQMIGTPLYMSPEQAEMSGQDADTRTDIYALGVLLYELLTGTTPFDKERLREADYDEIRRIIREEEPAKPSTRISTLGQATTTISTNRKSEPKRLSQLFRGELDWIVMKALEKDRNRRYESASAFAADVQRYLHDESVQACPPSAVYRFRKFARRNKVVLATAMALAAAVLVALGSLLSTVRVLTDSNEQIKEEQQQTTYALAREQQAKEDLNTALERERQDSYYQRIALADLELFANNLSRAEELLDACPADLRGWEWHYLKRRRLEGIPALRHSAGVISVVFSPDGRWIACGIDDGTVKVWDASIGQELFAFQAHEGAVLSITFSRDGRRIATAGWDATAKVWEFDPHRARSPHVPLTTFTRHQKWVSEVRFSPDGQRLASVGAGPDKTVRVWDAATGQEIFTCRHARLWSLDYSPDGQSIASASGEKTVKIWDARTGREKLTLWHSAEALSVNFSRDGCWLVSTTGDRTTKADGEIKIWDVATGQDVRTLRGHTCWIWDATFSPDGQRLASAGTDETVKLWDLRTGRQLLTFRGHRGPVRWVALQSGWDSAHLRERGPNRPDLGRHAPGKRIRAGIAYSFQSPRGLPQRGLQRRWPAGLRRR